MSNSPFDKKVVIITGSSMGIGKALAALLGSYGAKIVLNGRNQERLTAAQNALTQLGYEVMSVCGDITREADCKQLIESTIQRYGKIDVLVNNAGISMRGPVRELSADVISSIYQINAIAPIMLTQMALPHIKISQGSVVFISSLAGLYGLPYLSVYSAAKMSLKAITQALRIEHHKDGIHIGLVYVGFTKIEEGKTTLSADGKMIPLNPRDGIFTDSIEKVVLKISNNISLRKKRSIVGIPGKVTLFMTHYFPRFVEFALMNSQNRMKRHYK